MERRLVSMKLDRPNNVRRGQRITSKAMRRNVPRFSLFSLKESRNTLTGGGGVALLDSVWKVWRTYESLANVWKVWRTPFGLSGIYNDLNNVQWAMHLFWKQLQFKSQIRLALDIIWLLKADSFQGCGRGGGGGYFRPIFYPHLPGEIHLHFFMRPHPLIRCLHGVHVHTVCNSTLLQNRAVCVNACRT